MEEGAVLDRGRPPEVVVGSVSFRDGEFLSDYQHFSGEWGTAAFVQNRGSAARCHQEAKEGDRLGRGPAGRAGRWSVPIVKV